ncbi:MAG: phosphoribosylanthranilate isomerase [Bradymonadia bacterium]
MRRTRVKICCIASEAEAQIAIEAGADALGLVSAMPTGPGVISDDDIATIAASVPPLISTWLLTSKTAPEAIVAQVNAAGVDTVQLVTDIPEGGHAYLKAKLPGRRIVQVLHVVGPEIIDDALALRAHVDAILLDSGNPSQAELGGTGRTHDWSVSAQLVAAVAPTPVFLAGGLRRENIADAIEQVKPFGVDVCSGVRASGQLNPERLSSLIRAIHTD